MITRKNVHQYIKTIANARRLMAQNIKNAVNEYDESLVGLMTEYACAAEFEPHEELDRLYTARVPKEIFSLLEENDYNKEPAFSPDSDFDRYWLVDGGDIIIEAIVYKGGAE